QPERPTDHLLVWFPISIVASSPATTSFVCTRVPASAGAPVRFPTPTLLLSPTLIFPVLTSSDPPPSWLPTPPCSGDPPRHLPHSPLSLPAPRAGPPRSRSSPAPPLVSTPRPRGQARAVAVSPAKTPKVPRRHGRLRRPIPPPARRSHRPARLSV